MSRPSSTKRRRPILRCPTGGVPFGGKGESATRVSLHAQSRNKWILLPLPFEQRKGVGAQEE